MRLLKIFSLCTALPLVMFIAIGNKSVKAQNPSSGIGERPTLEQHISEADIENRSIKLKNLLEIGEFIFAARWTKIDGQGRPAATGNGAPTKRARAQRDRFSALTKDQQGEIVEFLRQLQVLPNGSPREITEDDLKAC